jgi:hypothetical protein
VAVEAARPQIVVLELKWTEDGQPKRETFGPWTQGDPQTEEGGLSHMAAAHGFLRNWCRAMGREPDEAAVTLVLDPDEWLGTVKAEGSDER